MGKYYRRNTLPPKNLRGKYHCATCGKFVKPGVKFCSEKCKREWEKQKHGVCLVCSRKYYISNSSASRKEKFCSASCEQLYLAAMPTTCPWEKQEIKSHIPDISTNHILFCPFR